MSSVEDDVVGAICGKRITIVSFELYCEREAVMRSSLQCIRCVQINDIESRKSEIPDILFLITMPDR